MKDRAIETSQPFPWFDDREIETEHDGIVSQDQELKDHLKILHRCFELLHSLLKHHRYEDDDQSLALLRLAARVFNSAGACIKVGRAGYFQPAFAMVRDILEIEFLVDMFRRDRSHLSRWMTVDKKTRGKEFQQAKIRKYLDDLDGFTEKKRAQAYSLLSEYAAHATPYGFHIISPEGMTRIGPFPSKDRLTALFQELTKHLQMSCIHIVALIDPKDDNILSTAMAFQGDLAIWRALYMPKIAV
jgi:hypothetical protein